MQAAASGDTANAAATLRPTAQTTRRSELHAAATDSPAPAAAVTSSGSQTATARSEATPTAEKSLLPYKLRDQSYASKVRFLMRSSGGPLSRPTRPLSGELDLWGDMLAAESAAEQVRLEELAAAEARQAWCDLFEQQPGLHRNPVTPAATGTATPASRRGAQPSAEAAESSTCETQPLSASLQLTLRDLLELHDCGLPVSWPDGFDARIARERLG